MNKTPPLVLWVRVGGAGGEGATGLPFVDTPLRALKISKSNRARPRPRTPEPTIRRRCNYAHINATVPIDRSSSSRPRRR